MNYFLIHDIIYHNQKNEGGQANIQMSETNKNQLLKVFQERDATLEKS